jgi:hypothetical protein
MNSVAVCYYQTIPHTIKVIDTEYAFVVRNNICLSEVKEEHADKVLNITKICCGNNKKKVYRRATETDIRRWNFGGR